MQHHVNLDVQPEPDLPASETAFASIGLVISAGLIIGAGIGAMVGHGELDNAFGLGQDVLIGAIVGAIMVGALGAAFVTALTAWIARHED